jgi:hypothetical protein
MVASYARFLAGCAFACAIIAMAAAFALFRGDRSDGASPHVLVIADGSFIDPNGR